MNRQPRRDGRRHLANRVLERNDVLVAHVLAEDARIVAERPRMHERANAVGIGPARVGAELHPRLLQLQLDVVLAHQEVGRLDATVLAENQIHRGVEIVRRSSSARSRTSRLPMYCWFSARRRLVISTPAGVASSHRFSHSLVGCATSWRGSSRASSALARLSNSFPSAENDGGRHDVRPGRAGRVRVHVRLNVDARRARRVDLRDHRRAPSPVARARRLEMVDLRRHAALARRCESPRRSPRADRSASERMCVM